MSIDNDNRYGVIYCPKHNDMKKGKRRQKVEKCLNESGVEYDFVQSESVSGVERLVRMLLNNGYKTIVVVGGDTALNDAINCIMQLEIVERNQITLGIIPNGHINDFAHFWGIEENNIEQAVDVLMKRRIRKVDVGCIKYYNDKKEESRRYFLNCVNIGFVANMMNVRRQTRHLWGRGWPSFLPALIMMIFQKKEYKMQMKINGENIDKSIMAACVGNASGYGLTPNAVPYNGLLDVSIVRHSEITQLVDALYLYVRRKFLNHKNVQPYRTQKVNVVRAGKTPVAVDGQLIGIMKEPFSITVEQEVLNLIIP